MVSPSLFIFWDPPNGSAAEVAVPALPDKVQSFNTLPFGDLTSAIRRTFLEKDLSGNTRIWVAADAFLPSKKENYTQIPIAQALFYGAQDLSATDFQVWAGQLDLSKGDFSASTFSPNGCSFFGSRMEEVFNLSSSPVWTPPSASLLSLDLWRGKTPEFGVFSTPATLEAIYAAYFRLQRVALALVQLPQKIGPGAIPDVDPETLNRVPHVPFEGIEFVIGPPKRTPLPPTPKIRLSALQLAEQNWGHLSFLKMISSLKDPDSVPSVVHSLISTVSNQWLTVLGETLAYICVFTSTKTLILGGDFLPNFPPLLLKSFIKPFEESALNLIITPPALPTLRGLAILARSALAS